MEIFHGTRSPVYGTHGMVASSQPLASAVGYDILKKGGNAVDAAVAMAAVLAVTEPNSTGLGGDCFMLYYDEQTKKVYAMNGSGRSPSGLSYEQLVQDLGGLGSIPMNHAHSVTVPGAVAGWYDAVEKLGSGKISFQALMEPAAEVAEGGFGVGPITAYWWKAQEDLLKQNENAHEMLSAKSGRSPRAGERFINKHVANVLRDIGKHGKQIFYEGWIGQAIVDKIKKKGGYMAMEDLKNHTTTWPDAIYTTYKDYRLYEVPPNGQGIVALLALNNIKHMSMDVSAKTHNSTSYIHRIIEALRLAFADGKRYCADMEKAKVPVEGLLNDSYAKQRTASFDPNRATADVKEGSPESSSCTVSFQVVDEKGNAVSFVNSNYHGFGTGMIPENCGFTLQNRGANFVLEEGHRNQYEPGKRPYHTIIPALITKEATGDLFATYTNMGGFMQPAGHLQVFLNLIECGMNAQEAVDAPRICIVDGKSNGIIAIEEGISDEVVEKLQEMGHVVKVLKAWDRVLFGKAQVIMKSEEGVLVGGSDARGDGCAMGW